MVYGSRYGLYNGGHFIRFDLKALLKRNDHLARALFFISLEVRVAEFGASNSSLKRVPVSGPSG